MQANVRNNATPSVGRVVTSVWSECVDVSSISLPAEGRIDLTWYERSSISTKRCVLFDLFDLFYRVYFASEKSSNVHL
jgi:hypothetical protein